MQTLGISYLNEAIVGVGVWMVVGGAGVLVCCVRGAGITLC